MPWFYAFFFRGKGTIPMKGEYFYTLLNCAKEYK